MSTKPTKHSHIFTLLSTCHQEPPWQRQEGTSGGSPIESGKTSLYVVKASLSNTCACSSEGSFSNLSWHADNKKAEPELSPQDKKGQRTAVITGFISVAFGVSITTAMAPTTMPEGAICCSTVHWSPCCTYCRNVCSSTGPGLCCTAPCVLHHSKNISIASHHRFTAGRLHGTEDRLQGA